MSRSFGPSIDFLAPLYHGNAMGAAGVAYRLERTAGHSLRRLCARTRLPVSEATRLPLERLEQRPAPTVVAPTGVAGNGHRSSVPNNAMDIVARAWSRGNDSNSGDANPATHRTMKSVAPTWLVGGDTIDYLWRLPRSDSARCEPASTYLCLREEHRRTRLGHRHGGGPRLLSPTRRWRSCPANAGSRSRVTTRTLSVFQGPGPRGFDETPRGGSVPAARRRCWTNHLRCTSSALGLRCRGTTAVPLIHCRGPWPPSPCSSSTEAGSDLFDNLQGFDYGRNDPPCHEGSRKSIREGHRPGSTPSCSAMAKSPWRIREHQAVGPARSSFLPFQASRAAAKAVLCTSAPCDVRSSRAWRLGTMTRLIGPAWHFRARTRGRENEEPIAFSRLLSRSDNVSASLHPKLPHLDHG